MFESFFSNVIKAPEFPSNFDWINTDEPLTLSKLKGQIVVLDFWTYCCINCMHMLPALSELEKKYNGKQVVFIGVHSGKFFSEQETKNVERAVSRYEIKHPVVVDKKMEIWNRFSVRGWPTIVIIDPTGTIVYHKSGEGQKEAIDDVIQTLLDNHTKKETLSKNTLKITWSRIIPNSTLLFPGKVSISNDMMAISDSNHNRIIICDLLGQIIHTIGNGTEGLQDGQFENSKFFRPQGVSWVDGDLYVADTENHAIRKINLNSKTVHTVAGTGKQGSWVSKGGKGVGTAITSPWDVAYRDGVIYIAMAGNHQIWKYDIKTGLVLPFAGTGQENIIDGDIRQAQLAQPSGLSIYENNLYFVDSETSSVRVIDLESKQLSTIVGHGLFEFGHQDGNLDDAMFQHPLGVCTHSNFVFVADTYNSAIRTIDLKSSTVSTLIGKTDDDKVCMPDNPSCNILPLYEPSDVEFFENKLYITDTNNHLIRIFDLKANKLETLELR